jgi:8-oxo-dGTP pyrophosphatase MutT (NUDIX family)
VRFYLFSGTENGIYLRNRKGEEIEDTAMREVEEETGVNQLRVTKKLKKTSHFKRNGKYKLKITHWFEMESSFEGVPQGQLEEGIEK